MKFLITGKQGQIGWELTRTLAPLGEVIALGRAEMDLTDADSIRRSLRAAAPNVIVNAAAYTAVDKAETERELSMAVNGIAPGIIAEEAKKLGALLVHYSTDYIFDGTKTAPYDEADAPNPLNVYGASKLAGERAIGSAGASHLILRTSWVYGARGRNFLLTILRLANGRSELNVVDDQIGAPTWSRSIANATARILAARINASSTESGVFHLTAGGSTSWFGFARAILAQTEGKRIRSPKLIPISTEQYNAPAKRPKNSVLSNAKLRRVFKLQQRPWQEELAEALPQTR